MLTILSANSESWQYGSSNWVNQADPLHEEDREGLQHEPGEGTILPENFFIELYAYSH